MKLQTILLVVILTATFLARFYRFDNPIADWHSWRQADTSAVSRNFVEHGYDVLHPRFDDISNVASGKDNPQGYRFVEFPIFNWLQAGFYQLFGFLTLEEWGRLVTITVSTLATWVLFLIVRNHAGERAGLLAALIFGLLPYNIYYGRVILPDTSMMAATVASIYFFDKWIEENEKRNVKNEKKQLKSKKITFYILALQAAAIALLLKPFAVFFFLPMVVIAYNRCGFHFLMKWQLWVFAILACLPLGLWRLWIAQYPEGIPVSAWLFNGNGIRFHPAFFRWIFYERVTKLISGYAGVVFLLLGIVGIWKSKERIFFASFFLASLLYVIVVATGNVQHDYYQIPIIPSIALGIALGAEFVLSRIKQKYLGYGVVAGIFLVSFLLGWNQVKDYFNVNNWAIVKAGQAVQKLTPKDAKIIAPYDGDTSFLYQTDRKGWPSFEHSTEQLITMGARYLVIVNPKPYDVAIGKTYKIMALTPDYIIFNLLQKP